MFKGLEHTLLVSRLWFSVTNFHCLCWGFLKKGWRVSLFKRSYRRLNFREREEISRLFAAGYSLQLLGSWFSQDTGVALET